MLKIEMNQPNLYNIGNWNSVDVDSWIRGIDPCLAKYLPLHKYCDGRWLINSSCSDLKSVGFDKVGISMLLFDSVKILIEELHQANNETLQNVIFRVFCDASSLKNYVDKFLRLNESLQQFLQHRISMFYQTNEEKMNSTELYPGQLDEIQFIKMAIVSAVLKLTNSVQIAITWLSRSNFASLPDLIELKHGLLDDLRKLNRFTQFVISDKGDQKYADIKGSANMIGYRTQIFIESCKDSLYLTPCIIENVQIHKSESVVFGINVKTLTRNLHIIESIDINSPAYNTGKLEEGDEILEINSQIIIGWCHLSVIGEIRSHPRILFLKLRKKPMHINDSINNTGRRNRNMGKNPVNPSQRGGVLSRPSKRLNQTGLMGSVSTPATPVLVSKNVHSIKENIDNHEIVNEMLKKFGLENRNLNSVSSDTGKNEEFGSEGEYSAADGSPYISRHKTNLQREFPNDEGETFTPPIVRRIKVDTFSALSEEEVNTSTCRDLGGCDCDGWLWFKDRKFVLRWCVLRSKVLYLFNDGKIKQVQKMIRILNSKLSPVHESRSKINYFKIYQNDEVFVFYTKSKSDYLKWFNKLCLSASGIEISENDGPVVGFSCSYTINSLSSTKLDTFCGANDKRSHYIQTECNKWNQQTTTDVSTSYGEIKTNFCQRDVHPIPLPRKGTFKGNQLFSNESISLTNNSTENKCRNIDLNFSISETSKTTDNQYGEIRKTVNSGTIKLSKNVNGCNNKLEEEHVDLVTCSQDDSQIFNIKNEVIQKRSEWIHTSEFEYISEKERSDEIKHSEGTSSISDDCNYRMNSFRKIIELERIVREKRCMLEKIYQVLKSSHLQDTVYEFWEEYGEEILNIISRS